MKEPQRIADWTMRLSEQIKEFQEATERAERFASDFKRVCKQVRRSRDMAVIDDGD